MQNFALTGFSQPQLEQFTLASSRWSLFMVTLSATKGLVSIRDSSPAAQSDSIGGLFMERNFA